MADREEALGLNDSNAFVGITAPDAHIEAVREIGQMANPETIVSASGVPHPFQLGYPPPMPLDLPHYPGPDWALSMVLKRSYSDIQGHLYRLDPEGEDHARLVALMRDMEETYRRMFGRPIKG